MRKIVQIVAHGPGIYLRLDGVEEDIPPSLFALCNDGTVWERISYENLVRGWELIEEIPQDGFDSSLA